MTQTILRKVDVKTWRKNQVKVDMPVSIECLDQDKIRLIYYPMTGDFFRQVGERAVKENPTEIWEELEVPVAGVTDEETPDQSLSCPSCNSAFFNIEATNPNTWEIECCSCKLKWVRSPKDFSKLAVTGNKPLKTDAIDFVEWIGDEEDQGYYYLRAFGKHAWVSGDYITGNENELDRESLINKHGISTKQLYSEFLKSNSTPIATLDKEALLKQAKDNAEKFFEWTSPGNSGLRADLKAYNLYKHVLNIMSRFAVQEYLRLCTGGGGKE